MITLVRIPVELIAMNNLGFLAHDQLGMCRALPARETSDSRQTSLPQAHSAMGFNLDHVIHDAQQVCKHAEVAPRFVQPLPLIHFSHEESCVTIATLHLPCAHQVKWQTASTHTENRCQCRLLATKALNKMT